MTRFGAERKFAVIGMGRFGRAVAESLYEMGVEVMAIDKSRTLVDEVQDLVTHAVALNATQKNLLLEQGVDKVDCAVVGIGENFEANVLVTSMLKSFGVPIIITRSYTDLQREILKSVGATQVLSPEEDMGRRLAKSLVTSEIVDFLELPEGFVVKQVTAPRDVVGRTLADAKLRNKYLIDVVILKRKRIDPETNEVKDESIVIPDGKEVIHEGDIMGVIGKETDIDRLL